MSQLTIGRIAWAIAFLTFAITYIDTLSHTLPRHGQRYVRSAWGRRLLLGVVEAGIVIGALILVLHVKVTLPLLHRSTASIDLIGGLLVLAAALLAAWAKIVLGRHFTGNLGIKEAHVLIQAGPYGLIRHPIYIGIVLFVIGSGLVWNSAVVLIAAAALWICFAVQSYIEDGLLAAHFGEAFEDYRARVPGILPRTRSVRRGAGYRTKTH